MNGFLSRVGYEWALWILGRRFWLGRFTSVELVAVNWLLRRGTYERDRAFLDRLRKG